MKRAVHVVPELAVGGGDACPAEYIESGLGAVEAAVVGVEAGPDVGHHVVELDLGRRGQRVRRRPLGGEGHRAADGGRQHGRRVDGWPAGNLNQFP